MFVIYDLQAALGSRVEVAMLYYYSPDFLIIFLLVINEFFTFASVTSANSVSKIISSTSDKNESKQYPFPVTYSITSRIQNINSPQSNNKELKQGTVSIAEENSHTNEIAAKLHKRARDYKITNGETKSAAIQLDEQRQKQNTYSKLYPDFHASDQDSSLLFFPTNLTVYNLFSHPRIQNSRTVLPALPSDEILRILDIAKHWIIGHSYTAIPQAHGYRRAGLMARYKWEAFSREGTEIGAISFLEGETGRRMLANARSFEVELEARAKDSDDLESHFLLVISSADPDDQDGHRFPLGSTRLKKSRQTFVVQFSEIARSFRPLRQGDKLSVFAVPSRSVFAIEIYDITIRIWSFDDRVAERASLENRRGKSKRNSFRMMLLRLTRFLRCRNRLEKLAVQNKTEACGQGVF